MRYSNFLTQAFHFFALSFTLAGCVIVIPANNGLQQTPQPSPSTSAPAPTSTPLATQSSEIDIIPAQQTTRIGVSGNVDYLTPRMHLDLSGVAVESGAPAAVDATFEDVFGNEHSLSVSFSHRDPLHLDYSVASGDPSITMAISTGTIAFNLNGNPVSPLPSDIKLRVTRTAPNGNEPLSYDLQIPVDATNLTQSNLGDPNVNAELKAADRGTPNYIVLGARMIDSHGLSRNLNIKFTHITPRIWLMTPGYSDGNILRVDRLIGETYQMDADTYLLDRSFWPAEVRFDLDGWIVSGTQQKYRLFYYDDELSIATQDIIVDLSLLTSMVGENTAIAQSDGALPHVRGSNQ